jgi:hypothetical protein
MRLLFFNYAYLDHGSAQDLHAYMEVARRLGHEVALYGVPHGPSPFLYTLDVDEADAIVLLFEFTSYVPPLTQLQLVSKVPRERRLVIDCDGKYNRALRVEGDVNHMDEEASRRWIEVCDSLSDKICQPTLHPLRPNVRPFFFHAYNPAWERPLALEGKEYGLAYVGNNWFRWRALRRVLEAAAPVADRLGGMALVGNGWASVPPRPDSTVPLDAYHTDPGYLQRAGVEVMPPVRFDEVIGAMSRALINPVLLRPLFDHLRLVTCRTFETPAASTIPLFAQPPEYVREIYGADALELVLPQERPEEKFLDILSRPGHYAPLVLELRRRLAEHHSYEARLHELVEIVAS